MSQPPALALVWVAASVLSPSKRPVQPGTEHVKASSDTAQLLPVLADHELLPYLLVPQLTEHLCVQRDLVLQVPDSEVREEQQQPQQDGRYQP